MTLFFVDTIFLSHLWLGKEGAVGFCLAERRRPVRIDGGTRIENEETTNTTTSTATTASGNTQKEGYGYNTRCERAHLHSGAQRVEEARWVSGIETTKIRAG